MIRVVGFSMAFLNKEKIIGQNSINMFSKVFAYSQRIVVVPLIRTKVTSSFSNAKPVTEVKSNPNVGEYLSDYCCNQCRT